LPNISEPFIHHPGQRGQWSGLATVFGIAKPIHVLLTDVIMPRMNGKALCSAATKINPRLKCVYMSGYPDNVIAGFGEIEMGLHFLQKPFGVDDLARKLGKVRESAPVPSSETGKA
jgi:two-component system cell cycle sensor histidine kinase/response regulator CckA